MLCAYADGVTVPLALFQLVFSAVVSLALLKLTAWQRRYEGIEDRLHEASCRLIDERFRAMTHEVRGHVQSFVLALDELKQRIQSGDAEVRGLGERDQRIELALACRLDTLKDYIRENTASKKDLEKHESAFDRKFTQVQDRMAQLSSALAVLTERVKD